MLSFHPFFQCESYSSPTALPCIDPITFFFLRKNPSHARSSFCTLITTLIVIDFCLEISNFVLVPSLTLISTKRFKFLNFILLSLSFTWECRFQYLSYEVHPSISEVLPSSLAFQLLYSFDTLINFSYLCIFFIVFDSWRQYSALRLQFTFDDISFVIFLFPVVGKVIDILSLRTQSCQFIFFSLLLWLFCSWFWMLPWWSVVVLPMWDFNFLTVIFVIKWIVLFGLFSSRWFRNWASPWTLPPWKVSYSPP